MNNDSFMSTVGGAIKRFALQCWMQIKYFLAVFGAKVLQYTGSQKAIAAGMREEKSHRREERVRAQQRGAQQRGGAPSRRESATRSSYDEYEYQAKKKTPTWLRVSKSLMLFFVRALATVLLIGVITGCIVGATSMIYILVFLDKNVDVDLNQLKLSYTSIIYVEDDNDNFVEYQKLHGSENREWVNLDEMRSEDYVGDYCWAVDAAVAIEDHRYFQHSGVDWKRTIYCFASYFLHSGDSAQGGSTITQQLIKNLTGENEVSIDRKLKEIFRALELEKKYTKRQILEAYLNVIALGNGCNGIKSAAEVYFGKEVNELTLAEAACIVGITKNPTAYNPLSRPEKNKDRQMDVLGEMLEYGFIDRAQYDAAAAEELVFNPNSSYNSGTTTYNNWYVDQIIYDLKVELVEKAGYSQIDANVAIYNGGLQIYSCMDLGLQTKAEAVFSDNSNFPSFPGNTQPQCAIAVMNYEGAVKCIVGARGTKNKDLLFSMASQARRQPGSSIKPLAAYGPAVATGILEFSTPVTDEKITIQDGGTTRRWPNNSGNRYRGNIPAVKGLEVSANCVAVRIAQQLTPTTVFKWLTERFHIQLIETGAQNDVNLSTSLGGLTQGVTVLEMTSAYAVFGSGGVYHAPYTYSKVLDAEGNVLITHSANDGEQAMSADAATIMNRMLRAPVYGGGGTAGSARISNLPTFGKTGTTSKDYDRYFGGGTPYYVSCCWFGYEVQKELAIKNTNHALNAWKKIMNIAHDGLPYKEYENMSSNVVPRSYCTVSGGFAGTGCPAATGYYVRNSSLPLCPIHAGGTATYAFTRFLENASSLTAESSSTETTSTSTTPTETTTTTTTPGIVITTTTTTTTTESTTTTTTGITVTDGSNPLDEPVG